MEAEKAEIEQILSLNSPSGFGEVKKLSERLGQLNQEIDRATELWLELAERVSWAGVSAILTFPLTRQRLSRLLRVLPNWSFIV